MNQDFTPAQSAALRRTIYEVYYNAGFDEPADWASEVYPGIWLSGDGPPQDATWLAEKNIKLIVKMASEVEYDVIPQATVLDFGIHDGCFPPEGKFEAAAQAIKNAVNAGNPVLVHCAAGISRSATAVIAYKMIYDKTPYRQALKEIRAKRPIAPHPKLVLGLACDLGERFIF